MIIETWSHLHEVLKGLSEQELQETINYEVCVYKRKSFINRLHQRYTKIRANREREQLLAGTGLL